MADEDPQALDPNELVRIIHPHTAAIGGPVTRQAHDQVWQHKGWTILDQEDAAAASEDERIAIIQERPASEVRAERLARSVSAVTVPESGAAETDTDKPAKGRRAGGS